MVATKDREQLRWVAHARIEKFGPEVLADCRRALGLNREPTGIELRAFCAPDDVFEEAGNLLTTIGLKRIWNVVAGIWVTTATFDGTTRGRIGVGDGTTPVAVGDTDLSAIAGSTHRQFARFDASFPTVSNGVITFQATHGTSVSNFHWQEWGIDGGTAAGTTVQSDAPTTPGLLNHKLFGTDPGTKTSASSWVFAPTITLS